MSVIQILYVNNKVSNWHRGASKCILKRVPWFSLIQKKRGNKPCFILR